VDALLPPDRAEDVLFNLEQRLDCWVAKYGLRHARTIFASQAFGTIIGYWAEWTIQRIRAIRFPRAS
jgi:hypothetical protein